MCFRIDPTDRSAGAVVSATCPSPTDADERDTARSGAGIGGRVPMLAGPPEAAARTAAADAPTVEQLRAELQAERKRCARLENELRAAAETRGDGAQGPATPTRQEPPNSVGAPDPAKSMEPSSGGTGSSISRSNSVSNLISVYEPAGAGAGQPASSIGWSWRMARMPDESSSERYAETELTEPTVGRGLSQIDLLGGSAERAEGSPRGRGLLASLGRRIPLLLALLLFQSGSSFILANFEELIATHSVIVAFLTMLVGAGGNAGNQVISFSIVHVDGGWSSRWTRRTYLSIIHPNPLTLSGGGSRDPRPRNGHHRAAPLRQAHP